MLKIDKEVLKELITANLYHKINSLYKEDISIDSDFKLALDEERENIIFTCAVKKLHGGNAWKRTYQEREIDIGAFNASSIDECLKVLFISPSPKEVESDAKFSIPNDNRPNFSEVFFYSEDTAPGDYDYYDNHNELRTIVIPIEKIADFIIYSPLAKDLKEYEKLFPEIDFKNEENKELLIMINKELLNNDLSLKENKGSKLKV